MAGLQTGAMENLDQLFARHHRTLYTLGYRLTNSREGAEDVAQESFLRILRYRHSYRAGTPFLPWATVIARNVATRFRRIESRFAIHDVTHDVPSPTDDPGDSLDRERQQYALNQALAALEPETRELLVAARISRQNYASIARDLGVTEGAVKVRVFRALKKLKIEFDRLAGEPR